MKNEQLKQEIHGRIEHIKKYPEQHRHAFEELTKCCMVAGLFNLALLDAHSKYAPCGQNGGSKCDTVDGPCSCGAWHTRKCGDCKASNLKGNGVLKCHTHPKLWIIASTPACKDFE